MNIWFWGHTDSSSFQGFSSFQLSDLQKPLRWIRITKQNVQRTFTVRKTCVKRKLKAWIEHHKFSVCFSPYVIHAFLKNMRLTDGMRNIHFTIPWKALCLHITTHALK